MAEKKWDRMKSKFRAHILIVATHFPLPWALISPAMEEPAIHHWIYGVGFYIITVTSCSVKTQPIRHFFLWWQKARKIKRASLRFRVGLYLLWERIVCYLDENLCLDSGGRDYWATSFKILVDFRHVVIYRCLSQRQNKHPTIRPTGISLSGSHAPGPH